MVWNNFRKDHWSIFFRERRKVAVNVNGFQNRAMIEKFLRPEVENNSQLWFQQDGPTIHTARPTMALLREIFGDRIIPRFSHRVRLIFFFGGFLTGEVYANKPRTIQKFKANIREEVTALGPEILRK